VVNFKIRTHTANSHSCPIEHPADLKTICCICITRSGYPEELAVLNRNTIVVVRIDFYNTFIINKSKRQIFGTREIPDQKIGSVSA